MLSVNLETILSRGRWAKLYTYNCVCLQQLILLEMISKVAYKQNNLIYLM